MLVLVCWAPSGLEHNSDLCREGEVECGMWNASYFRGNMEAENPPLLLPDLDLDKSCFSLQNVV